MRFLILILTLTYSYLSHTAIIDGISVSASKKGDSKSFFAKGKVELESSLTTTKNAILDFNNRCNQKLAKKRTVVSKEFKCKFHNPSLVESVVIKDLRNKKYTNDKKVLEEFLVWRNVYNRNAYSYYDLIVVRKIKENQINVSYKMLNDEEVSFYLNSYKKKKTAFDESRGVFKIQNIKSKIHLTLNYTSKTGHWLLTSSLAESTILEKVASGTKLAIDAVKKESESKR